MPAKDAETRERARAERVHRLREAQRTEAEARLQRLVIPPPVRPLPSLFSGGLRLGD
jgi:hypothetical protein